MLKKYSTSIVIIRLSKLIGLALLTSFLLLSLAPILIRHTHELASIQVFLLKFKWLFLVSHGLFYIALYGLWPKLVLLVAKQQRVTPSSDQLKQAIQSRVFVIAVLLMFELLNVLR